MAISISSASDQLFDTELAVSEVFDFLRHVSRNMLAGFPDVQRWDQTDDIFQQAALRLHRALQQTTPESRRHLENLAALQVRRTLIELGRSYATRVSMNRRRWTPEPGRSGRCRIDEYPASGESDPARLIEWVELHEQIELLPADEQEVFQLIWYRELPKSEVARILNVDLRTVQRRWRAARESLASRCDGMPPL
jgi:RNA polymerase sigma-70 factor (ECF subfamily)